MLKVLYVDILLYFRAPLISSFCVKRVIVAYRNVKFSKQRDVPDNFESSVDVRNINKTNYFQSEIVEIQLA